jgi:hypothetical protein
MISIPSVNEILPGAKDDPAIEHPSIKGDPNLRGSIKQFQDIHGYSIWHTVNSY